MPASPGPWDPGLQVERTALAWRRTILSAYGAALLAGRLLLDRAPVLAVVLAATSTLLVTAIATRASLRHRITDARLRRDEELPDAKLFVAVTALAFLAGVTALATVLLHP